MKKMILIFALLINVKTFFGQNLQNANWCFGTNSRLNFNSSPPTATSCSIDLPPNGGGPDVASVSDDNGQLLFYTNGTTVWGKNHVVMPNGTAVYGSSGPNFAHQYISIVPKPGQSGIYYIFDISFGFNNNPPNGREGLYYSVVDMSLNSGNGDIVPGLKNIPLKDHNGTLLDFVSGVGLKPENAKVTTALNISGDKIWVVFFLRFDVGGQPRRYVYSYLVSINGVNGVADGVSPLPTNYTVIDNSNYPGTIISDFLGSIKISSDGSYLCDAAVDAVNLYNFNNQTGSVSFNRSVYRGTPGVSYSGFGVEFSPNSQLLYFSTYNNTIFQEAKGSESGDSNYVYIFQNRVGTDKTVEIARFPVDSTTGGSSDLITPISANEPYGLQRAINNKIYVCVTNPFGVATGWLGLIDQPDLVSPACNFIPYAIQLYPGTLHWGSLPQWVHKATISTGPWVWMKGDNIANQPGVYGTQGVPSLLNTPSARNFAMSWTDLNGDFWLFGGRDYNGTQPQNYHNDLWKFNVATNSWTWMKGSSSTNQLPVYGFIGVSSPTNDPGARRSAMTWVNDSGDLMMFGGILFSTSGPTLLGNDLWKYNINTNEWTWVKGDNTPNQMGVYGTLGVSSINNKPGSRSFGTSWKDNNGNLWMFGGSGISSTPGSATLNDLWKYNPSTNEWTWMKGTNNQLNFLGVYGTQGVPNLNNCPGVRAYSVGWTDGNGNLWLFGGQGFDASSFGHLNDLWKFEISSNTWTWMKGDNVIDQIGTYGVLGSPSLNNKPGARFASAYWKDNSGNFWLFGGFGLGTSSPAGLLNDLWKYDINSNTWTWINGANTNGSSPIWGIQGVGSPGNNPGGRWFTSFWKHPNESLWLFGGTYNFGIGNDLWKYTGICGASCRIQEGIVKDNKIHNTIQAVSKQPNRIITEKTPDITFIKTIYVYNSAGQLIKRLNNSQDIIQVMQNHKIEGVQPGLYFLKVFYLNKTFEGLKRFIR